MLIIKVRKDNIAEEIEEFERVHNFRFPKQYRDFLLKYGGGLTPRTEFKTAKMDGDIKWLSGFGDTNNDNVNYDFYIETQRLDGFLKDMMIPIGNNSFGDKILLSIAKDSEGVVFFRYHDRPKRYIRIADDFKSFVACCKSEIKEPTRSVEENTKRLRADGCSRREIKKLIPIWEAQFKAAKGRGEQEELILD